MRSDIKVGMSWGICWELPVLQNVRSEPAISYLRRKRVISVTAAYFSCNRLICLRLSVTWYR